MRNMAVLLLFFKMTNSAGGKRGRMVFGGAGSYVRAGGVTTSARSIALA
jgi:hypothetical protein